MQEQKLSPSKKNNSKLNIETSAENNVEERHQNHVSSYMTSGWLESQNSWKVKQVQGSRILDNCITSIHNMSITPDSNRIRKKSHREIPPNHKDTICGLEEKRNIRKRSRKEEKDYSQTVPSRIDNDKLRDESKVRAFERKLPENYKIVFIVCFFRENFLCH